MKLTKEDKHIIEKYNLSGELPYIIEGSLDKSDLHIILKELGLTVGAEIGLNRGHHAERMFAAIPGLKLYGIDCWESYPEYRMDFTSVEQDNMYIKAKKNMANLNCEVIKGYSMDVVKQFKDGSLDFVYIDANHEFRSVIDDISEWGKKVKVGGIVSGHDFEYVENMRHPDRQIIEVIYAVTAWVNTKKIEPWYVINGYNGPIWMWVKQHEIN
jgi:hypothetical protein